MEGFKEISARMLQDNVFKKIGDDWMLITAGDEKSHNTMTASWGSLGVLWNRSVATIFVRPQRYTYKFIEENDVFTLSMFGEDMRSVLAFCGSKSGRDYDKDKECNLTPIAVNGGIAYAEANMIIVCRKLFFSDIKAEDFVDKGIIAEHYSGDDFHRMYVGEILGVYVK